MREFLSRLELFSVWDKFPADFTHLHTDGKNTSTIDHFFVNQRLLDLVQDAGPVHLGDNPSRHSPIMMKIKIPELKTKISPVVTPPPRKPAWYKAAQADKDHYTSLLDSRLRALTVPDSLQCQNVLCKCNHHSEERDSHLIDILCTLIETSYECIPLTAKKNDSKSMKGGRQAIPGWKETILPLKSDSLFWHSVWISAGRPAGALHKVMSQTRNKYHSAVKKLHDRVVCGSVRTCLLFAHICL